MHRWPGEMGGQPGSLPGWGLLYWIVVVFVGIYRPISIQLRIVCYFLEVRKFNKTSVSFGSVLPTGEEL